MASIEEGRSSVETDLISDLARDFIDALNFNTNSGANIPFRTFANYKVSYIPACRSPLTDLDTPSLEINSTGIDALFYARIAIEGRQMEIVRAILLPGCSGAGESEIGIERVLSLDEEQAAAVVAMRPSRASAVSVLMGLTLDEELALSNRQAEILAEAEELARGEQEAIAVANSKRVLKRSGSIRPFDLD